MFLHIQCVRGCFAKFTEEVRDDLAKEVTMDEFYHIMTSIGLYKAPGPNGFQAVFFQSNWDIAGPFVLKLVSRVWCEPWRIKDLNAIFLCPIPKIEGVISMK